MRVVPGARWYASTSRIRRQPAGLTKLRRPCAVSCKDSGSLSATTLVPKASATCQRGPAPGGIPDVRYVNFSSYAWFSWTGTICARGSHLSGCSPEKVKRSPAASSSREALTPSSEGSRQSKPSEVGETANVPLVKTGPVSGAKAANGILCVAARLFHTRSAPSTCFPSRSRSHAASSSGASDVESGHERHLIGNRDARVIHIEVVPQAAGDYLERIGHCAMFVGETVEGFLAAFAGIDIEHEDPRAGAGRDTNVGASAAPPDLFDNHRGDGGRQLPVFKPRVFAWRIARSQALPVAPRLAGTDAAMRRMQREDAEPALCAGKGAGQAGLRFVYSSAMDTASVNNSRNRDSIASFACVLRFSPCSFHF